MSSSRRHILPALVLLAAMAPAPALAQAPRCPFTEGPPVDRLRAVLGVVRQGDLPAMRRALESMWRPGAGDRDALEAGVVAVTRLMLQGEGFGEIVLCTPKPGLAVAVLRDTLTAAADQLVVEVEPGPDARVTRVTTALATRRLPDADAATGGDPIARLGAFVDRLAARGAFSGVVIVGRGGETLFARAWGEADREAHVPVTLDTPFNVASLSKMMTATAVLQLVEAGRLSLDTEVASILPDVSTDPRFAQVRVKHLLSHTSGIEVDPNQLAFAPGSGFLYSNRGFRLLGDVIAARTGMRFEDYLRLKVLAPAGMASTARYELKERSRLLTLGYTLERLDTDGPARTEVPSWHVNPYLHTIAGGAMGGLYSTGPDLLRFASALLAGKLVSAQTLDLMRTPKPELGAAGYGFGVMRERTPGVWGHGGDLPGADAALEFYADGHVVVVLANMDNVAAPILQTTRALFHHPASAG